MSSLVAMPSARGLAKVSDLVTRDAMSAAVKAGTSAELADKIGQLFQHWTTIEDTAKGNKSVTGAYVHRASRDANGGTVDAKAVNDRLGVQTSTRYGYIARLYFDFGFDPADGVDWTSAIGAADKDKDFRELLNREPKEGEPAVTKQDLLDHIARKASEKEANKGKGGQRKPRPESEKDDDKGADKGGTVIVSNSGRNAAIATLVTQFQTSEASEKDAVGFLANIAAMEAMLPFFDAATLASARAILAKDDTAASPAAMPRKRRAASAASAASAK